MINYDYIVRRAFDKTDLDPSEQQIRTMVEDFAELTDEMIEAKETIEERSECLTYMINHLDEYLDFYATVIRIQEKGDEIL